MGIFNFTNLGRRAAAAAPAAAPVAPVAPAVAPAETTGRHESLLKSLRGDAENVTALLGDPATQSEGVSKLTGMMQTMLGVLEHDNTLSKAMPPKGKPANSKADLDADAGADAGANAGANAGGDTDAGKWAGAAKKAAGASGAIPAAPLGADGNDPGELDKWAAEDEGGDEGGEDAGIATGEGDDEDSEEDFRKSLAAQVEAFSLVKSIPELYQVVHEAESTGAQVDGGEFLTELLKSVAGTQIQNEVLRYLSEQSGEVLNFLANGAVANSEQNRLLYEGQQELLKSLGELPEQASLRLQKSLVDAVAAQIMPALEQAIDASVSRALAPLTAATNTLSKSMAALGSSAGNAAPGATPGTAAADPRGPVGTPSGRVAVDTSTLAAPALNQATESAQPDAPETHRGYSRMDLKKSVNAVLRSGNKDGNKAGLVEGDYNLLQSNVALSDLPERFFTAAELARKAGAI